MSLPSYLFGFVVSTLYGAVFHFWRGGRAGRLLLYLVLSWVGFWIGHFLGAYLEWGLFKVGPLYLGMASAGSLLFLGIGYWLSQVQPIEKSK